MEAETDDAVWTRLDASLHLAIAQASGNPVFGAVMASIAGALSRQSEHLNGKARRADRLGVGASGDHRGHRAGLGRGG